MSFLAMAPDDGLPGTYPYPGPVHLASPADVAVPALAAVAEPLNGAGPDGMASTAGGMAPGEGEAAPLVDPAALQELGAGLDDPAAAGNFARDYIRMWEHRRRSLAAAIESGDEAGSLDAVLSLKIASAMVGGIRLSRLARKVEAAIRGGDMDLALSLLPEVAEHGRQTVDELQAGKDLPGA